MSNKNQNTKTFTNTFTNTNTLIKTRSPIRHKKTTFLNVANNAKPSVNLWDQWLAGFIDGDGCLLISPAKQCSCEITTCIDDEPLLRAVQQKIGGSLKLRAGSKSVRLRVTKRSCMVDLCQRINGHVHFDRRVSQFKKMCTHLGMELLAPQPLSHAYITGLFDADGSVTITIQRSKSTSSILPNTYGMYMRLLQSRGYHQLRVQIDSSDPVLLSMCQDYLGIGSVITKQASLDKQQRRPNVHYRWHFQDYESVSKWLEMPYDDICRSVKVRRLHLLPRYFVLKSQKAHLAKPSTVLFKAWRLFCISWFNVTV